MATNKIETKEVEKDSKQYICCTDWKRKVWH